VITDAANPIGKGVGADSKRTASSLKKRLTDLQLTDLQLTDLQLTDSGNVRVEKEGGSNHKVGGQQQHSF
jgi:hypothetical protein